MALKLKDGSWSELLKHLAIFKAVFLAEISRNIEPIFVLLLYPCTAPAPSQRWCAGEMVVCDHFGELRG